MIKYRRIIYNNVPTTKKVIKRLMRLSTTLGINFNRRWVNTGSRLNLS